mmetsp:Transcript_17527/g.54891  ORF Transcript_17527/g.54891 Transcript_17527/m.54891 type:complete len:300 (-) Transcript_17527:15-914(-)
MLCTLTLPGAHKDHPPDHDEEGVEGQEGVIIDAEAPAAHMQGAGEAGGGRQQQPHRERVHPGKIHGHLGAKVAPDGVRRRQDAQLPGAPDLVPLRAAAVQGTGGLQQPGHTQRGEQVVGKAQGGLGVLLAQVRQLGLQLAPVRRRDALQQRPQQLGTFAGLPEVGVRVTLVALVPTALAVLKLDLPQALARHVGMQARVCLQVAKGLCLLLQLVAPCAHEQELQPVLGPALRVNLEPRRLKPLPHAVREALPGMLGEAQQVARPLELVVVHLPAPLTTHGRYSGWRSRGLRHTGGPGAK